MSNGLTVGPERYILVRNDPGVTLMLKKGLTGLVASKANQCKIFLFSFMPKIVYSTPILVLFKACLLLSTERPPSRRSP